MKTTKTIRFILLAALLIAALSGGAALADTEKNKEDILLTVDKSALSQDQKTALLNRALDAMTAGIPPDDVSIIISRGVARGWDGKSLEGLMTVIMNAKEQNLPLRSVLSRIEQGLSKGVSPEKIMQAATVLIMKTAAADGIVDNLVRGGMKTDKDTDKGEAVQTVARALERSVPEDTIIQLGQKAMKNNLSLSWVNAAVTTMTTFIEMGMPQEQAQKLINRAADKGYKEGDMTMMEKEFFNGVKSGSDMNHIMQHMESMMNRGGMGFSGMSGGSGMHGGSGGMGGGMHGGSGGMGGGMHGGR